MFDEKINEQLALLHQELSRLRAVTDYIDGAKSNAIKIIDELGRIQQNYTVYSDKVFELYKQYAQDVKDDTGIKINEGVLKFETTGNQIDKTNREKLVEIKRLLDQYKNISEAADELIKEIKAVNFPVRLTEIESNIKISNITLESVAKQIEADRKILDNYWQNQEKGMKTIKTLLYVICALIVIGTVAGIFFIKQ